MKRRIKQQKPYIYVFCEGESEQRYVDFLAQQFGGVILKNEKGSLEDAKKRFQKDPRHSEWIDVIDEIWLFFDVEEYDIPKWEPWLKVIKWLEKMRKDKKIRVRLLMTTACVEYWFLLHYRKTAPLLQTKLDKEKMLAQLRQERPNYEKASKEAIFDIAKHYETAIVNGAWTLERLTQEGLIAGDETKRNEWLFKSRATFTTVHEALVFLKQLPPR